MMILIISFRIKYNLISIYNNYHYAEIINPFRQGGDHMTLAEQEDSFMLIVALSPWSLAV